MKSMNLIRQQNLEYLLKLFGTQRAVADALDTTPGYINQLLTNRRQIGEKSASRFESLLKKPTGWMDVDYKEDYIEGQVIQQKLEIKEPITNVTPWHQDDVIPDGFYAVEKWKVSFSAGNGHNLCYELIEEGQPALYRNEWFQRELINPKHARRFDVVGDSMEPFLFPGDTILVDTSETDISRIIDGRVYAIRYGNELRVKRLFRKLDGTIVLRSDNPIYQDENVSPELVNEHIALIGRVRDRSGGGGL
jgi:phage repressor protein C with HTH and peptisase S24 domain